MEWPNWLLFVLAIYGHIRRTQRQNLEVQTVLIVVKELAAGGLQVFSVFHLFGVNGVHQLFLVGCNIILAHFWELVFEGSIVKARIISSLAFFTILFKTSEVSPDFSDVPDGGGLSEAMLE